MGQAITRDRIRVSPLAVNTALNTTKSFLFDAYSGGMIFVPVGSTITTLTFYCSQAYDSIPFTALPLQGPSLDYAIAAGSPMVITVAAGKAYPIPQACFGAGTIAIVGNHAGNIDLLLKV